MDDVPVIIGDAAGGHIRRSGGEGAGNARLLQQEADGGQVQFPERLRPGIQDGKDIVAVAAEKVAQFFEATSDIGDWNGSAKLTPTVKIEERCADGTIRFNVRVDNVNTPSAFLRIKAK